MFKKRLFLLFIIFLFLCINCYPLLAQEKGDLQISYHKVIWNMSFQENLPEAHFLTHISIITDDSIPLLIKLPEESNFNKKVHSFSFKNIKGDNKKFDDTLIRVKLRNCGYAMNYVTLEYYSLKRVDYYKDIPGKVSFSSYSNLSPELRYYTRASKLCQAKAPKIMSKAQEFIYTNRKQANVINVLQRIVDFTGNTIEYEPLEEGPQTAINVLNYGHGVCTGKANLAVALARSLGIPAKVLVVQPCHYIAEFWIPDYGWVRGESTHGIFPIEKHHDTIMWIADMEDENYAAVNNFGIIAYWGIEGEPNIYPQIDQATWEQGNWVEDYAIINGDSTKNEILFSKGKELWQLFCRLKNAKIGEKRLSTFSEYQELYFHALVNNNIQNAIHWADRAIAEAKRLLNL